MEKVYLLYGYDSSKPVTEEDLYKDARELGELISVHKSRSTAIKKAEKLIFTMFSDHRNWNVSYTDNFVLVSNEFYYAQYDFQIVEKDLEE